MPLTEEQLESLYPVIGKMTVSWALIEGALDCCVVMLFAVLGGNELQRTIPGMLQPRVEFVRKAFTLLPALSALKDKADQLCSDITALSTKRHNFTHGIFMQYSSKEQKIMVMRLRRERFSYRPTDYHFALKDFPKFLEELRVLGASTTLLAIELLKIVQSQPPSQSRRPPKA